MRFLSVILAATLLVACGGGGSTPEPATSISVSPGSIQFTGTPGEFLGSQNIVATFKGSGVLVGFPPGVEQPSWLSVAQSGPATATSVTFALSAGIEPGLAPGTYSVPLRFVTGIVPPGGGVEDATDVTHTDATVTLTVLNFSLARADGYYDVAEGANTPIHSDLALTVAAGANWTTSSNQSWLTVAPTAGTGPVTLDVVIDPTGLATGGHTGVLTVNSGGRSKTFTAHVNVQPNRLTVTPTALTFDIAGDTSPAARTKTVTISDQLDGLQPARALSWTHSVDAAWLTLSPTSGSTSPAMTANVVVSSAALAGMANGTYTATVTLTYTSVAGGTRQQALNVTLNLNSPLASIEVQSAGPENPVAGGGSVALTAIGTYAAGYQADLRTQVQWASSVPAFATVGNVADDKGVVRPLAPGTTSITATHTASSVVGTFEINVTAPAFHAYILPPSRGQVARFIAGDEGILQRTATTHMDVGPWPTSIAFAPDGDHAYVLQGERLSGGDYGLTQYAIDAGGTFVPLEPEEVSLGSGGASAMTVDATGQHAYTAAYCGGPGYCLQHLTVGSDGTLTLDSQLAATYADYSSGIVASPFGPHLYLLQSNVNKVAQYAIGSDGALTPMTPATVATGTYPIDMVFDPTGIRAYIANFTCCNANATGAVSQYDVNGDGSLSPMAIPSVMAGKWPRQVVLNAAGTEAFMVYSAESPESAGVATFLIDATGNLILKQDYNIGYARYIALDPTGQTLYLTTGYSRLHQMSIGPNVTLTDAVPPMENVDGTEIYVRPYAP